MRHQNRQNDDIQLHAYRCSEFVQVIQEIFHRFTLRTTKSRENQSGYQRTIKWQWKQLSTN